MIVGQSYSPTRTNTPSKVSNHRHCFNLIKQHQSFQEFETIHTSKSNKNIFKDLHTSKNRNIIQKTISRPIGGTQLFKKMQQATKDRGSDHKRLSKRSNNCTQRNINILTFSQGLNRFKKDKNDSEDNFYVQIIPMKSINQNIVKEKQSPTFQEEIYKQQMNYTPFQTTAKNSNRKSAFQFDSNIKSEQLRPSSCIPLSTKQNRISSNDKWAADQRKSYHDKMALINQIDFNKPLVQRYGDRYFEYLLRNRFNQQLSPSPYVYLLKGQFSRTKTIQNIKKWAPQAQQKESLILKGRKLTKKHN